MNTTTLRHLPTPPTPRDADNSLEREAIVDALVDWDEGRHQLPGEGERAYAVRKTHATENLWRVFFSRHD